MHLVFITMEKCWSSADCMETVQTFIEEITQMVFKDRVDDKNGHFANNSPVDGYTGSHCDVDCLVKTVRTAAGQAGAVAMAVGQKHFYGNDALWNRWSPQRVLELDRAIRQLKGRNLAKKADAPAANASYETDGHVGIKQAAKVRKLDLAAFRYNGTAEVPLLHHPKISRVMARKILSYIPGWGADPEDRTHDAELGEAQVPAKDYFLATDITPFHGFEKFDPELKKHHASRLQHYQPEARTFWARRIRPLPLPRALVPGHLRSRSKLHRDRPRALESCVE